MHAKFHLPQRRQEGLCELIPNDLCLLHEHKAPGKSRTGGFSERTASSSHLLDASASLLSLGPAL